MAGTQLRLRVRPGARRSEWAGRMSDGRWKVAVAAPPEAGRANRELVAFVARTLGVAPGAVRLVAGGSGRDKVLEVDAAPGRLRRLGELLAAASATRPRKGNT